jgi:1,2-phenylacetyl-CoA epoxidase catalytic subunit
MIHTVRREYPPASIQVDSPMTSEYRQTLLKLLADQARAELWAAHTYSSWVRRVHDPEEKLYLVHMASEETEHWYKVVKLLQELGVSAQQAQQYATRSLFYPLASCIPRLTWLDILMLAFLIDRGAYFLVEDFAQSSYAPRYQVAREILQEEEGHSDFGTACIRKQIQAYGLAPVQRVLNKWWRVTLNMFGPALTKNTERYIRLGLKFRSNEERRQAFCRACEPEIKGLGLELPKLYRQHYPFF